MMYENLYSILFAIVGGFIDEGESPLTSAKREVLEELGLGSRRTLHTVQEGMTKRGGSNDNTTIPFDVEAVAKVITDNATISDPPIVDEFGLLDGSNTSLMDDDDWIFLGRYRTAANRGGGFLYSYLLKNAVPLVQGGGRINYKGTGDGESQEILFLSGVEVMTALSEGRFQEVKWTATLALAMLHLNNGMPSCCDNERQKE
jgi:8-oxo-dGTP pyrophosphatase MutT (NUDIX family)